MVPPLISTAVFRLTYYADSDNASEITGSNAGDAELIGSSRLGWSGKVALNNTWSGIAKTEWQVASENSDNNDSDKDTFRARHIWVGFDGTQYGKIIFGQTDTAFYDVLEPTDIFNEWAITVTSTTVVKKARSSTPTPTVVSGAKCPTRPTTIEAVEVSDVGSDTNVTIFPNTKRKYGYAAAAGYDFDFGLGLNAGYAYPTWKTPSLATAVRSPSGLWRALRHQRLLLRRCTPKAT